MILCVDSEVEFCSFLYTLGVSDVKIGVHEAHKKGFSSAWRLSNLVKRTNSVERRRLRLYTVSTFTQGLRHCIQLDKELSLRDQEHRREREPKTLRDSFIYFLDIRS